MTLRCKDFSEWVIQNVSYSGMGYLPSHHIYNNCNTWPNHNRSHGPIFTLSVGTSITTGIYHCQNLLTLPLVVFVSGHLSSPWWTGLSFPLPSVGVIIIMLGSVFTLVTVNLWLLHSSNILFLPSVWSLHRTTFPTGILKSSFWACCEWAIFESFILFNSLQLVAMTRS